MWPFKSREPFQQIKKTAQKQGDRPVDYFVSAGLDFKGQAQMAYEAAGYGLGADFSLDAGKLLGFLELGVGVSGAVTRANGVMFVAQRGPDSVQRGPTGPRLEIPRPLCLSSMMGVVWEAKVGVSFELGVGFEASASASLGSGGAEAKAERKTSATQEEDEDEPGLSLEAAAIGVSLEGRAGFGASASYTYQNLYVEDVSPQYYAAGDKERLRADLEQLFRNGSNKAWVKEGACQFLTSSSKLGFKALTYKGLVFNTASKEIHDALAAGCAGLRARKGPLSPAEQGALADAVNWMARLQPYLGGAVSSGLNKLHLSSHSPAGEAGFTASLELKAGAGPIGELKVAGAVQGPSVAVSGKRSSFRYQTAWAADNASFLSTQDTVISYSAFERTLYAASVAASASSGLAGRGKSVEAASDGKVAVQRLSYVSSTLTWESPDLAAALKGAKEATLTRAAKAPALPGSGFAFGQSCVVGSLARTYGAIDPEKGGVFAGSGAQGRYLSNLACELRIPLRTLTDFLMLPEIYAMLRDLNAIKEASAQAIEQLQGPAFVGLSPQQLAERRQRLAEWTGAGLESPVVLIEATFAAPASFEVPLELKRSQHKLGRVESCELARDARKRLLEHGEVQDPAKRLALLQSLRLRWRIQDQSNRDADAFSLGFKIVGQEARLRLARVDRASSEGIADLAVVWLKAGKPLPSVSTARAFNDGVPAVTLFCQ